MQISGANTALLTILFTDIEGSTLLWEQDPERMRLALARHDEIVQDAVDTHRGTVVKMLGDGMQAAFEAPLDALAATLRVQQALADPRATNGIALQVRCGLHLGAVERRNDDLFGTPVNRTARIMAAAYGGQVLLSKAVAEEVKDRLPSGSSLRDLGSVRLRNLATPEHVYQLMHPELRQEFPALRSLDSTPNNLPQQLTSFVGREKEIAAVKNLLEKARMLTLTGAGGCGKTRLSLHVAADLLDTCPDGVWLVELAPLADPDLVPQTVATVLGLKEPPGKSLTQTLVDHFASRQLLLLLDNAEHLLAACAQLADALLRQCPQVRLLVSSREAIGMSGELTYRVPSLSMPDPKRDTSPEALSRFESVRLFVERAQSHVPQFAVTDQNAPPLASICYRLDGIPLALELAAARVRSLSVEEVNRRLDRRFRLLTGGSRTALPRQQTLQSLIDWSYDLLSKIEQALLGRLSVFASGWALEAAERVCSGEDIVDEDVLDVLTSLADKSLLAAEERNGATRYRLLETVRQYARDRLLETGNGRLWRDQHLAYFVALSEEAEPKLWGPDQPAWLDRLETEHDNLRSALAWSTSADGDALSGLRLAGALSRFWSVRGYWSEGRGWLSGQLATDRGANPPARAKALSGAGSLAWRQADVSAAETLHTQSLALRRTLGDRNGIASSLGSLSAVARDQSDYPLARSLNEESLAIRRELGDRHGIADALTNLGALAYHQGDYAGALTAYDESLSIRRALGDRWGTALALNNLGAVADAHSDYPAARARYEECLAILRELGDRFGVPAVLNNLGEIAYAQGDYAAARVLYAESLDIRREVGDRRGIALQLNNLGRAACAERDYPAARDLHGQSVIILRDLGDKLGIAEALEGFAHVAFASAEPDRALRIWSSADQTREHVGCPLPPKDRSAYDGRLAAARAALGSDAAIDSAWQEGRAMTLEQAIEYALHA